MPKRRRRRLKKSGKLIIVFMVLILAISTFFVVKQIKLKETEKEHNRIVKKITSHYNNYVTTKKDADIFDKDGNSIGKIAKNVTIVLEDTKIDIDTNYFKLAEFEDTYIKYNDVKPSEKYLKSDRYKKYIPYNKNIITKEITNFYDEDNNLVYTFNKSYDFPIIIKDDKVYGIEFNNELLYIKKEDVEKTYEHKNTDKSNTSGVAVLNYHAFYDETNEKDAKSCTTGICMSKKQFKQELDYFKEINIFTVTMHELELFMDSKLQLPKSVLITIDDGGKDKLAVDMLTEYKMNATIFLITSRFKPDDYYVTEYIELHSHSHDLHKTGVCSGGQGGGIKCLPKATILNDLKTSRELLHGSTAFCYPFYEYNEYSTNLLKEAGFTMAFIGEVNTYYGYKLAEVNGDKYHIPRFVMFNYTTISDLKEFFAEIK